MIWPEEPWPAGGETARKERANLALHGMHWFESEGVIDRPVEEVWRFVLDADNFPSWNRLGKNSSAHWLDDEPAGLGSTLVLSARVGPLSFSAQLRIVEFDPYRTLVFDYSDRLSRLILAKGSRGLTQFTFESLGISTKVTKVATGQYRWFLSPLVAGQAERYKRWIPMLKRAIEAD